MTIGHYGPYMAVQGLLSLYPVFRTLYSGSPDGLMASWYPGSRVPPWLLLPNYPIFKYPVPFRQCYLADTYCTGYIGGACRGGYQEGLPTREALPSYQEALDTSR